MIFYNFVMLFMVNNVDEQEQTQLVTIFCFL